MESAQQGQQLVHDLMAAMQAVGASVSLPAAREPAAQAGQAGPAQG